MSVLFAALANEPRFEATLEFFELEVVSLDVSVIIQRSVSRQISFQVVASSNSSVVGILKPSSE